MNLINNRLIGDFLITDSLKVNEKSVESIELYELPMIFQKVVNEKRNISIYKF